MVVKFVYASGLLGFYMTGIFLRSRSYDHLLLKYDEIDLLRSRKKRALEFVILASLGFLISIPYFYGWLLLCLLLLFRDEWRFYTKTKELKQRLNYDFPLWLRYVQGSLAFDTVYVALQDSLVFAPALLKDDIKLLLRSLEEDPQSAKAYEAFLQDFGNFEVLRMMMNLYRYHVVGKNEAYSQLKRQVERCNRWIEESRQDAYEQILNRYTLLSALPMIMVSFLFMVLMFQVMIGMLEGGWVF